MSCIQMKHHFDKSGLWDLEQVFSSRTIREFDSRFTSHMFGYRDCKAYYTDACLAGKLDTIKVPLLALNALDDAFQVRKNLNRLISILIFAPPLLFFI